MRPPRPGITATDPTPGSAFDRVAREYDQTFTHTALGRALRRSVWRYLDEAFSPGQEVLELGCGTGEDALHLAARGVRVTATDGSPGMLAVAREKAAASPAGGGVRFAHLELGDGGAELPIAPTANGLYDGAFSDFGALNCVSDRSAVGAALAARLRPGAALLAVLMGPFCPVEVIGFLLRGRPRAALRRWHRGGHASLGDGSLPVWYPSPRALRRELAPWFHPLATVGLGTALPPTDLGRGLERHPRLLAALARLDAGLAPLWPAPWLADHFLLLLERRSGPR